MKKFMVLAFIVGAATLVVGACGDDDDKNDCEKATDVATAAANTACSGKSDTCWACDCYNQNLSLDFTMDGTHIVYSCVTPDPVVTPTCDGTTLSSAQDCLANETSCANDMTTSMNSACTSTTK
jgi:hypothetical protein